MRAVRVNGKITEVKQSALGILLRWDTTWDPNILTFFTLAMIGKNIRQICQILLISLSFGKTQMNISAFSKDSCAVKCKRFNYVDYVRNIIREPTTDYTSTPKSVHPNWHQYGKNAYLVRAFDVDNLTQRIDYGSFIC